MTDPDGAEAPREPLRAEVERDGATTRVHIAGDTIDFEAAGPVMPDPPDETFALWVALPIAARLGRDLVVAGTGFSERDRKNLEREVHARLGERVQVDIRQVASIPREPNGKFRAVKSSVAGLES